MLIRMSFVRSIVKSDVDTAVSSDLGRIGSLTHCGGALRADADRRVELSARQAQREQPIGHGPGPVQRQPPIGRRGTRARVGVADYPHELTGAPGPLDDSAQSGLGLRLKKGTVDRKQE